MTPEEISKFARLDIDPDTITFQRGNVNKLALYNCNTYFSLNKTKENLKKGNIDSSSITMPFHNIRAITCTKYGTVFHCRTGQKCEQKRSKEKAA